MNTCPECNMFLGNAGHREGCSKSGLSPVRSNDLLSVEYQLQQIRHDIITIWQRGTLQECQDELSAVLQEVKRANKDDFRFVKTTEELVTDNKVLSVKS